MSPATRKERIGRFARAALKQALGVVTGDRRLEAEGAAEQAAERAAQRAAETMSDEAAARPRRRGRRSPDGGRDAR